MRCPQCNGRGMVTIDDTGLSWYLKEGPCPACGGSGVADVDFRSRRSAPFGVGDLLLWGFISGICWAIAGAVCALCVINPVGSMVVAFAFVYAITGVCAGVFALMSFFGIYAVTRDMSTSYGLHLTLMSVLALIVGLFGAFSVLPHIDLPPGVEIRDAVVRVPICGITAIVAMVTSLRSIARLG